MRDEELKNMFDTLRQDVKGEIGTFRLEVAQEFANVRQEMQQMRDENITMHAETRRYVQVLLENDTRVQAVAEAVLQVDERLTRETDDIRREMRAGFAETQAMIKFSHAELDRRITALEQRSA